MATIGSALAEPHRQILTSTERNIWLDNWEVTETDVGWESSSEWSVRKQTLHGGKQDGVDLITVDNGALRLIVIPTRGMGVLSVDGAGVHLGWESPVKEVVHPRHVNLHSRGGLGWLDGFNEWMVRCGLESAGHPGKDKFITNTGDEAEMDLTLHGKIANIPASEVTVLIDDNPPYRIRVRGRVDERMFYGPKLELWTEISTIPGSLEFRIEDTITNHGGYDQEFQLIYHANYGAPLLDKGSAFLAPVKRVTPFNDHAAKSVNRYEEYQGPTLGFVEQVYCLFPLSDRQGRTLIMLRNSAGNQGVSMSYNTGNLPYLTQWKNTNSRAEGYVTGLEPATGFPFNRSVERKFGRVPKLKPGEKRTFAIDFALLANERQIEETTRKIRRIQGNQAPQIDTKPVALH